MKEAVEYGINIFCKNILALELNMATMLGSNFYGTSIPLELENKLLYKIKNRTFLIAQETQDRQTQDRQNKKQEEEK